MTRAQAIASALLGVLLTVPGAAAQAQNAVITGKVTTDFGQPLEGANVYITEMNISVGTDAKGAYTITIPAARQHGQQIVLRARSFGFVPANKPMTLHAGSESADFVLKQDINRLQEVVVTGVTAGMEQRNLPFTVAHIDDKDLPVPGADPLQALQGKVAGVTIAQTNGRPGSSLEVLLRGPQSINGASGQGPLYIVDGVEIEGDLPDLNPQDIETVEVVKGAAAASLYGSRAGNGVIQITTKTGKAQGAGVHFNLRTENGVGDIEHEFPFEHDTYLTTTPDGKNFCVKTSPNASSLATCAIAVNFGLETARINNVASPYALAAVGLERDGGIGLGFPNKAVLRGSFANVEWPVSYNPIAQATTNAPSTNNTVDASGSLGSTNFFTSFNNYEQQNQFRFMDGYKRNSIRLNLDQNVGSDWTFGLRTYYANSVDNGDNGDFLSVTRQPAGANLLGVDPVTGHRYILAGILNENVTQNENPVYYDANNINRNNNTRFLGDVNTKYTPFSWGNLEANLSFDRAQTLNFQEEDKGFRSISADPSTNDGYVGQSSGGTTNYNGDLTAAATHDFGRLNARLTGRYIYEQTDRNSFNVNGGALVAPGLETVDAVTDAGTLGFGSNLSSIRAEGLMTSLDLEYKDRYILSGLVRRDGSSLFGSDNRWANYGRISGAWIISDEPWWILPAFDNFKLRASYGTAGVRPTFTAQYETFSIGNGGALSANQLGNKNLRPQLVAESEFGIDGELLNKYGFSVDFVESNAYDQLLQIPPSASSGFSTQWQNAGTLQNKTWEATLNVPVFRKRNSSWTMHFNYDRNRAVITALDEPPFTFGTNAQAAGGIFLAQVGERYGNFYGRKFATSCSDLPAPFNTQCGGAGSQFQKNDDGFIVWTGGHSLGEGITENLWQSGLMPCVSSTGALIQVQGAKNCLAQGGTVNAPFSNATGWGMPIVLRDSSGGATTNLLGNSLPNFRLSTTQTFNYKRFFVYGLFDGSFGRRVFDEGRQWAYGDLQLAATDQVGRSVEEAKPLGYFWRTGPQENKGVGGLYDVLGPNNNSVEDASYIKLREVNLSYNVGPVSHFGDWTVSFIGRNLKTWTKYKGFDPEVGRSGGDSGSAIVNALDYFNFPPLRTFTVALATKF